MQLRNLRICNLEQCGYQVTFDTYFADSAVACCPDIDVPVEYHDDAYEQDRVKGRRSGPR